MLLVKNECNDYMHKPLHALRCLCHHELDIIIKTYPRAMEYVLYRLYQSTHPLSGELIQSHQLTTPPYFATILFQTHSTQSPSLVSSTELLHVCIYYYNEYANSNESHSGPLAIFETHLLFKRTMYL